MKSRPARKTGGAAVPAEIEEAAASWWSLRQAGSTPEEDERFRAWLAADPRHGAALNEFESAWRAASFPHAIGQADRAWQQLERRARRRRRRAYYTWSGLGLAATAALMWLALPAGLPETEIGLPTTVARRPDHQRLPDGSVMELNAATEVAVDFSAERRVVRLMRGEALFEVARDTERPFVVTAGSIEVRAVGTAFAVRYDPAQVDVLVTEGRVTVARVPAPAAGEPAPSVRAEPLHLTAGKRVEWPMEGPAAAELPIHPLTPEEVAAALAWREQRIEFTRASLAEAIALFNRQNRLQLMIGDGSLDRLRISGIFWAGDPEGFVRLLETGFNLKAERTDGTVTLRAP